MSKKLDWTIQGRLEALQSMLDAGKTPYQCGILLCGRCGINKVIRSQVIYHVIARHGLRYVRPKVEKSAKFIRQAAKPQEDQPPVVYAWDFSDDNVEPGDRRGRIERVSMGESMTRGGGD